MRKNLENAWTECRLVVKSVYYRQRRNSRLVTLDKKMGTEHISEVSFPHKLMQEYLAGYYLTSLFREKPTEFDELLKQTVLDKYDEFRYLPLLHCSSREKTRGQARKSSDAFIMRGHRHRH